MPPDACRQNYNTAFAGAVVAAKMKGMPSFRFKGTTYRTDDYTNGVAEDLKCGRYRIVCRKVGSRG